MNRNKIILYIAIIAVFLAVVIPTVYNINVQKQERLYHSMELRVIEASKKCLNAKKCKGKKVFIKQLIDNKYLKDIINPHTNKKIDENSYVRIKDNKYELITVE